MSITRFFSSLGLPLKNQRWSWGAQSGSTVLLRTWSDELTRTNGVRRVVVLKSPLGYLQTDSFGLDERFVHLENIWRGGMAAYAVVAIADDPNARPRSIQSFREDVVFIIERLEELTDGTITAVLGTPVKTEDLSKHAASHTTLGGEGPFPAAVAMKTGASSTAYQERIPLMRKRLEEVCRAGGTLTYGEVMSSFGLTYYPLNSALGRLGNDCRREDEPIITAIVVEEKTGRCSIGFMKEFQIEDDEAERQRCYVYWAPEGGLPSLGSEPKEAKSSQEGVEPPEQEQDGLAERAARFASVEVRPQQAAFRLAVFNACGGRCVVSGCEVPEALEAAHLSGRDWRSGHNSAEDGILLRRDIHTLYDRGLLSIGMNGQVEIAERLRSHYGEWQGISISPLRTS